MKKSQRPDGQNNKATAGLGVPLGVNPGLNLHRIEELNPRRWHEHAPLPFNPQDNHGMTGLTVPSLGDNAADDETILRGDTPMSEDLPDAEDDPNMESEGDPMPAEVIPHDLGEENSRAELGNKILIPMLKDASYTGEVPKLAEPKRIMIEISDKSASGPTKLRFSLDEDGDCLKIEAATPGLNKKESSWWRTLSPNAKRSYLEKHPNSKYGKAYRKALAAKKARKGGRPSSQDPKVVRTLDNAAKTNEEAHEDAGIDAGEGIAEELDNEQDMQLDELDAAMNEHEDSDDDADEDREVDTEAAEQLGQAASKPGFFKPVVNAIKKRASNSTLGAMSRFMKGGMREGDNEKVAKGLTLLASAVLVVGVGAGVGMLAGPGVMTQFVSDYMQHLRGGGGDGIDFDFSADASDSKDEPISDADLEKLSKGFTKWLVQQTKKGTEE